jgi:hypothetical protein
MFSLEDGARIAQNTSLVLVSNQFFSTGNTPEKCFLNIAGVWTLSGLCILRKELAMALTFSVPFNVLMR